MHLTNTTSVHFDSFSLISDNTYGPIYKHPHGTTFVQRCIFPDLLSPNSFLYLHQGTSYLLSGHVKDLTTCWSPASRIHFVHLTIEDDFIGVEIVFPSSHLRRIVASVFKTADVANADYMSLLDMLGGQTFEVMVTVSPRNNAFAYFELVLVKLFLPLEN
ncbi:unnamed protein product [Linum trigynum]|uniref:Uncharacterized protein n=1 Tax=Linum trigynum TaxID=586398 RepID=A0AAV2CW33_9ROSI